MIDMIITTTATKSSVAVVIIAEIIITISL